MNPVSCLKCKHSRRDIRHNMYASTRYYRCEKMTEYGYDYTGQREMKKPADCSKWNKNGDCKYYEETENKPEYDWVPKPISKKSLCIQVILYGILIFTIMVLTVLQKQWR